jgi:hypothetical protein
VVKFIRKVIKQKGIDGMWLEMYRLALGMSGTSRDMSQGEKILLGATLLMSFFFVNYFQAIQNLNI